MTDPVLETLTKRLDRLESDNRWLKRVALLLLLGATGAALLGQAPARAKSIEAEQFVVTDSSGQRRATLSVLPEGLAGLVIGDAQGAARVAVSIAADGTAGVFLSDGRVERAEFSLAANGDLPRLILSDRAGVGRARVAVLADGSPAFVVSNEVGKTRAIMAALPKNDGVGMLLADRTGAFRTSFTVKADGASLWGITDKSGRVIWKAP